MPGLVDSGNHHNPVQKTIKDSNAVYTAACSHVRSRYPQAGPQFPGASEKAESRCAQGFAGILQSFFLDP
ncbi:hypothetical protein [Pseudomonas fluorescens]|uniref:hypothetical protein n=1 Tax=Pseudomonas fluorescens TaxID=294 RepID=UPI00177CCB1A|nr:hypothetical protein [Pseudomonas fluorescens]